MDKKIDLLKKTLEEIFSFMGVDPDFTIDDNDDENSLAVKIWNEDLSFLIGYRGNCLKALKYYLSLVINKETQEDGWTRVNVDIDGYVERRQEKIEEITRNYIDKVRFFGQEIHMPNMDSSERFMVHNYVGNYPDIISQSEGQGFSRHVVLKPANKEVEKSNN
ncbi:KH domain-containing protein [Patescibacteria group bacterium]|nr:KH domain-containing protein [Patescibacteria group bacterium]HOM77732.1 R3H domain-containing nucleic acid-binding protein [bacterium]